MADRPEYLKEFFRALQTRPIGPDNPFYVDLYANHELAPSDPVATLAQTIRWSDGESRQLFSGFRGTGKSTELRRLKARLEDDGHAVFLCDMQDYLNLTTAVDVSDFLISVAGAFGEAVDEDATARLAAEGGTAGSVVLGSYYDRLQALLGRLQVDVGLSGAAGPVDVKVNLKQDPSFRKTLQRALEGRLGRLVDDVRQFVAELIERVRSVRHDPACSVVLILDSLEQIRGTSVNDREVTDSLVNLFQGHADKLGFADLHVVYTVPPWLKIHSPGITTQYSGAVTIPCVKVKAREDDARFEPGIAALRDLVGRRGDWIRLYGTEAAFDPVVLASGGYLRDLFRLVQQCLHRADGAGLPLPEAQIALAIQEVQNHYLPQSHQTLAWLAEIHRTKSTELPEDGRLADLARYIDNLLVMTYRNGDEWWDVHPLLLDAVRQYEARERG